MKAIHAIVLTSLILLPINWQPAMTATNDPKAAKVVDASGNLRVPGDYRTAYQFLGSWAVAADQGPGSKEIHTVYASPGAAAAYRKHGRFTDGSLRATNGTDEMRSYKMGPSMRKAGLVLMAVLGSSPTALAADDSSAGQTVFATHCVACHSTQPGKNEVGPSLAGIVGSKSASVPGYDFSPAMKDANITWDDANLDKFLANPLGFVPGTKMF